MGRDAREKMGRAGKRRILPNAKVFAGMGRSMLRPSRSSRAKAAWVEDAVGSADDLQHFGNVVDADDVGAAQNAGG